MKLKLHRAGLVILALGLVVACGDSGSSSAAGGSGSVGGGGSGAAGAGAGGSGGTAGAAPCGPEIDTGSFWCECQGGNLALTSCGASGCDGQAACEESCADDGGVVNVVAAEYVAGADCDTVCGYVCACEGSASCDVFFECSILPGQTAAEAAELLRCKAENADGWGCDANGDHTYDGPTTCN